MRPDLEALERKPERGDTEGLKAELYCNVGTKLAEHYVVDPESRCGAGGSTWNCKHTCETLYCG